MPPFGRGRIRRFWHDVSSHKKLAARDYEAFLVVRTSSLMSMYVVRSNEHKFQTIMPAIEDLFPSVDEPIVQDLLFELAVWHALAKLRLHTEVTLDIFRKSTQQMYEAVTTFANTTCLRHQTRESAQQAQARVRREQVQNPSVRPDGRRKEVKYNVVNT